MNKIFRKSVVLFSVLEKPLCDAVCNMEHTRATIILFWLFRPFFHKTNALSLSFYLFLSFVAASGFIRKWCSVFNASETSPFNLKSAKFYNFHLHYSTHFTQYNSACMHFSFTLFSSSSPLHASVQSYFVWVSVVVSVMILATQTKNKTFC